VGELWITPGKRENNPEKGRANPEKGRIKNDLSTGSNQRHYWV
jgi:hypothetical protein